MSRCFPYPPPGYVKNGICDEALIESIKLLREGEKAKKKRKERKKEKIWEKKEKKVRVSEVVESKEHRHKRHKDDRNQEGKKGGGLRKKTENELEKSSLTEEHGHSVGSQDSSDSTLSSTKRQKLSSPPDGENNSGSITWIRLPLRRQNDPKALPSSEQPCTASGGTDGACTQAMQEHAHRTGLEEGEMPCSPSREITGLEEGKLPCTAAAEMCPELTLRVNEEKPRLSTSVSESSAQMAETVVPSSLCGRCSPQLALKFRDAIENWVPPPMEPDCTFGYKEWLFGTRQDRIHGAKICEAGGLGLPHANSTTLSHVCYLPEVDMYALPFTVPY